VWQTVPDHRTGSIERSITNANNLNGQRINKPKIQIF